MKRPAIALRRRPPATSRRRPRSRTEAAIALVRAEFERERLERDLNGLDRRRAVASDERRAAADRSRALRAMLAEGDAPPLGEV